MNKRFLTTYIAGYLVSYFLIAGWVNAANKVRFGETLRHRRQNLGCSLAWSAAAAAMWPVFLPVVFCCTGLAQDGWSLTTAPSH